MRYLIQSVTKATTNRGKDYLRMTMYEPGGKLWTALLWESKELEAGQVVDALTELDSYNGQEQLKVKAIRVLDEKPTDEFLPRSKNDSATLYAELQSWVGSVKDPGVCKLLSRAIGDTRWLRAPAAQKIHHAYLGGLVEHVVNLCRLADAIAKLYPALRRDLLIAGAVLHDIGKLDELEYQNNIEYTTDGNLLGHIVIGYERAVRWMDEIPELSDENRRLVRHIIISHHGQQAYGSPKPPQIAEAAVFTALDGLDATLGTINAAIDRTSPGKSWTDRPARGEAIYIGEAK